MLKHRILTALVLIPLFLLMLFKLSPQHFALVTSVIIFLAANEWSGLMGIKKFPFNFIYPFVILFLAFWSMWLYIPLLLTATTVFWLLAAILVIRYPKGSEGWGKSLFVRGLMGVFTLIPCWIAINFLRYAEHGAYTLLFLFVLIWGADSGAYFVGKKWGKTPLAPAVSPGKSWQGLMGALATTLIIVMLTVWLLALPIAIWIYVVVLSFVTVLFSVLGDLFESMLKRNENIKDSGSLLPGHGGLLDRIDSLTAAAPIFALGAFLLTKII